VQEEVGAVQQGRRRKRDGGERAENGPDDIVTE
jgi:hypothetical protein